MQALSAFEGGPGSLTAVTSRVAELGLSLRHAGLVAWWCVEFFKTRDQTWVSFIGRYILNHLDHQGSPYLYIYIYIYRHTSYCTELLTFEYSQIRASFSFC